MQVLFLWNLKYERLFSSTSVGILMSRRSHSLQSKSMFLSERTVRFSKRTVGLEEIFISICNISKKNKNQMLSFHLKSKQKYIKINVN